MTSTAEVAHRAFENDKATSTILVEQMMDEATIFPDEKIMGGYPCSVVGLWIIIAKGSARVRTRCGWVRLGGNKPV